MFSISRISWPSCKFEIYTHRLQAVVDKKEVTFAKINTSVIKLEADDFAKCWMNVFFLQFYLCQVFSLKRMTPESGTSFLFDWKFILFCGRRQKLIKCHRKTDFIRFCWWWKCIFWLERNVLVYKCLVLFGCGGRAKNLFD